MRKLLTKATGVCAGEATSQMQLNWRRVKKEYFSVYLFRSAVTANAVSPVRRTTTVLKAMQMRFGRYRACRAGLTERQLAALEARLESHGYVRLRDTVYKSWKEMHDACEKDAWRYNAGVLDDPSLPEVGSGGRVRLKEALLAQHVYSMLQRAGLRLGYKPNAFGLWSLRRYSIAMVVKSFGIYLGTRQAQHNKATGSTVQSTYDADNGSLEVGAAEMDRPPEDIEPGDSLAETRVPAIFEVQRPSDVPKDSDAWRTMVLEDEEYVANAAALAAAAGRIERAVTTAPAGGGFQGGARGAAQGGCGEGDRDGGEAWAYEQARAPRRGRSPAERLRRWTGHVAGRGRGDAAEADALRDVSANVGGRSRGVFARALQRARRARRSTRRVQRGAQADSNNGRTRKGSDGGGEWSGA